MTYNNISPPFFDSGTIGAVEEEEEEEEPTVVDLTLVAQDGFDSNNQVGCELKLWIATQRIEYDHEAVRLSPIKLEACEI